jgi:hypothetical protein
MKYYRTGFKPAILICTILAAGTLNGQLPAFPGAEGFGKYVTGGRGGDVIAVTNLLDDPADPPEGSFRWVLKQAIDTVPHPTIPGITYKIPRRLTVVFRVSGIIELQDELTIQRGNLTLAGQTAPGDGICFKNRTVTLRGDNVIIRYLRFRPGLGAGEEALSHGIAGLDVENCNHVMVDHCSFSWANEECAIFYDNHYTTVQWCIASEGLYNAYHAKGSRSYCGVWGGQYSSIHHNFIAHNWSRTIRFNGARAHDTSALVDYRNNVIYNWGKTNACYGGEVEIAGGYSHANMVNNYYKPGPATPNPLLFIEPSWVSADNTAEGTGRWFIDGNIMVTSTSRTDDNWLGVSLDRIPSGNLAAAKSDVPFRMSDPLPTETAEDAYQSVLSMVGAVYPRRDTVDARVVQEAISGTATGTGTFGGGGIIDTPSAVGGYPEYLTYDVPVDADQDGMDDAWEQANGLDPGDPEDRNDIHESGYTMLEVYLNGLVEDFTQILNPVVHVKGIEDHYCIGTGPVSMTGSPSGGQFTGGSAMTVYGDSVVFYPADTGNYELKYVYSDGEGFTDSVMEVISVHPIPEPYIVGLDTFYHVDDRVFLSGEPVGGKFIMGTGITLMPESQAIFQPKETGEYEVIYWYKDEYGCIGTDTTRTLVFGASGTRYLTLPEIRLYPNPAGDQIRISAGKPVIKVTIYDQTGRLLKEIVPSGDRSIGTGDLKPGIYYLRITTTAGRTMRKFVKN